MNNPLQNNLARAQVKRSMRAIMARGRVMPVLTIEDASQAGRLARTLVDGGVLVFEVVLRTPAALDALIEMRKAAPEADIGAGTLLTPMDVERAIAAGAAFGVLPGCTPELAEAVQAHGFPFLPGVASASEVMLARQGDVLPHRRNRAARHSCLLKLAQLLHRGGLLGGACEFTKGR